MQRIGAGLYFYLVLLVFAAGVQAAPEDPDLEAGRELFTREWLPEDQRSAKGDGLGPVYNDTSCVACHNQGGVGGAGPGAKDVLMASVFANGLQVSLSSGKDDVVIAVGTGRDAKAIRTSKTKGKREAKPKPKEEPRLSDVARQRNEVAAIHPAFRSSNTIVLHHFSTLPTYAIFQASLGRGPGFSSAAPNQSQVGNYTLLFSRRNTPALFGSGVIEAIPDDVLEHAESRSYTAYPQVSGRVARLPKGKLGRFGWKAQQSSLEQFVLTACAVELGLEVPGVHQGSVPRDPEYKSPGVDLTAEQCDDLTAFVASLSAPSQQPAGSGKGAGYLAKGKRLFEEVGCAACHTPNLGEATGIYSDLLLHDMGLQNSDLGAYGAVVPNSSDDASQPVPPLVQIQATVAEVTEKKKGVEEKLTTATRLEWRTPPLWGVRDSAPYLHDARAATLEQAISLHGGEAEASREQFLHLLKEEQQQLTFFLRSLVAPAVD